MRKLKMPESSEIRTYCFNMKSPVPKHPRAVALGIFDGVHLGHRAVIMNSAGVELPEGGRAFSTVFTFSKLPPVKENPKELMSLEQKKAVFKGLGVDELILADFEIMRDLAPEQFVNEILKDRLDARRVCCGFNYRFGKDGAGDAETLRRLCQPLGIEVVIVPPVEVGGEPVSSTRIRRLIENGEMEQAAKLLGRPFTLDIEVAMGQKLGRLLGVPTINQVLPDNFIRPKFGVYISCAEVEGVARFGITNIGIRPTVGADKPLAETWIIDFEGDLYGKRVPVTLVKFLREEKKFGSVEELKQQILSDAGKARAIFAKNKGIKAVLFDFDDTLQNRKIAFTKYCRFFVDRYFPSLDEDEKQARVEYMVERNYGGHVNYIEYISGLIDEWGWSGAPAPEEIFRELQFRFPEFTTVLPESVGVLKKLKSMGYKVGIITNGPSLNQNRKLDISGLRPYVDLAIVAGDMGVSKPNPEIFRRAALYLGVPCENCVYVGDNPKNDIQGALSAGMKAVYIDILGVNLDIEGVPKITALNQVFDVLKQID